MMYSAANRAAALCLFLLGIDLACALPQNLALAEPQLTKTFVTVRPEDCACETAQPSTSSKPSIKDLNQTASAAASTSSLTLQVHNSTVDPFRAIATGPPPTQITSKAPHPVPTLNIVPQSNPLQTNKFYANLFLGKQTDPVWTDPYSVAWSGGDGSAKSWGLAISHIDPGQRAFGAAKANIPRHPASYLINPVGIQSLIFSASELGRNTELTTDTLEAFSVNANLRPGPKSASSIRFPLVQGIGMITGVYDTLTPVIQSGVGILNVSSATSPKPGLFKYRITTNDHKSWLMYVAPKDGATDPKFALQSGAITGPSSAWSGIIQIGKNPAASEGETLYDAAAGVYATSCALNGSVSGAVGSYTFTWTTSGTGSASDLLMYSLNHHQQTFDNVTATGLRNMTLATTTAGNATAIVGNSWTLVESTLPVLMGFAPWSPTTGSTKSLSSAGISAIQAIASADVAQDMNAQTNINSFYYAGKGLFKFAQMLWTLQNLANSTELANSGLARLERAFELFTSNKNAFPLVYDDTWKGAVSSAWQDSGADFGNSFYNDHHFHYGYFLGAAAIVGEMDPNWLAANKDYINTMARDVSNPSADDNYFPVFRSFDWYHGHSWAKGLFDSGDGKDEESSSEDVMFAYGLKMWGKTIGDASMEARGNLMLSVLSRSLHNYILMTNDNTVQPPNYIANKAVGITFQNKLDHATYFGANLEYVEGIHMLPLIPASTLSRNMRFVEEEWNTYFAENATDPASAVVGGWRGILYANLAIIDAVSSFQFFNTPNFNASFLDGGASLTWYLAFAAGLGGA